MTRIAFLGLGTMGYQLAGHLRQHHPVTVLNRTRRKAEDWCTNFAGTLADTPAQAAATASHVFVCVGNDEDVRAVLLVEQGALAAMQAGSYLIDHSTTSPSLARELDERCKARGIHFMDAPVSGGVEGARNGNLTVMCGAAPDTFTDLQPLLACYASNTTLIGPAGAGQAAKMINQICVVGILQSLAEGLHLAHALDLDVEQVINAISQGAAGSWQMQKRWRSMLEGNFDARFSVKWMAKDLAICLSEAQRHHTNLPVTRMIDGFYRELMANGEGEQDITSLMKRLTDT